MRVPLICALPVGPEEGAGFPGTGVRAGYELPCGCWESKQSPLGELLVLLITEPSLLPRITEVLINQPLQNAQYRSLKKFYQLSKRSD